MNTYQYLQKNLLIATLETGFAHDGLKLVLANSNTWEYELPSQFIDHPHIVLDIKGWALEQSYVTDDGVFIQTAFGEDENSKLFSFDEVIQVISFDGKVLYQKVMQFEEKIKEPEQLIKVEDTKSFKGKISTSFDETSEGAVYSMSKMMEMNKNFKKK